MERRRRIWLGIGAAVLVGGSAAPGAANAPEARVAAAGAHPVPAGPPSGWLRLAQASGEVVVEGGEGGEGEGGEGGGQILGTITEFRLSSTDPAAFRYDATPQVAAYAALVHDRYVAAHAAAAGLRDAVAALLADPTDATLAAARAAWLAGHAAYSRTEAFQFYAGPVDGENGPVARLNAWPVNPGYLDATVAAPDGGIVNDPSVPLNRAALARLNQAGDPANVTTGWHAIEFLLWGEDVAPEGPGTRPASDFAAGVGNSDRRRDVLRIATQLLVVDLSTLVAAWAPDANNYRSAIVAMDQRNAIGRAFNGMAVMAGYELGLKRIGAGLRRGGDHEQSQFSDSTAADTIHNLEGVRDVYFGAGTEGAGFVALVAGIDPALNERVVAAFDRAGAAVAALDEPYDSILASPRGSAARTEAEAAVDALKDLADALRAAGNRLGVLVLIPGV